MLGVPVQPRRLRAPGGQHLRRLKPPLCSPGRSQVPALDATHDSNGVGPATGADAPAATANGASTGNGAAPPVAQSAGSNGAPSTDVTSTIASDAVPRTRRTRISKQARAVGIEFAKNLGPEASEARRAEVTASVERWTQRSMDALQDGIVTRGAYAGTMARLLLLREEPQGDAGVRARIAAAIARVLCTGLATLLWPLCHAAWLPAPSLVAHFTIATSDDARLSCLFEAPLWGNVSSQRAVSMSVLKVRPGSVTSIALSGLQCSGHVARGRTVITACRVWCSREAALRGMQT